MILWSSAVLASEASTWLHHSLNQSLYLSVTCSVRGHTGTSLPLRGLMPRMVVKKIRCTTVYCTGFHFISPLCAQYVMPCVMMWGVRLRIYVWEWIFRVSARLCVWDVSAVRLNWCRQPRKGLDVALAVGVRSWDWHWGWLNDRWNVRRNHYNYV